MTRDPVAELAGGWRRGIAASVLAARLRCWGRAEPALAGFGSVERLFRFLRSRPSRQRDEVFCALLRWAQCDQLAGLVVLEALLPGLKALRGRILAEASENDEVWTLLLAAAWEQIVRYPLARRPGRVAANVLLDVRKTVLRELAVRRHTEMLPLSGLEVGALPGECDIESPLRRAIRAGVLSASEAELILQTRVDGRSLPAVAAELGVPYITVYKRRARAERRLVVFLGGRPGKIPGAGSAYEQCSAGRPRGRGQRQRRSRQRPLLKEVTGPRLSRPAEPTHAPCRDPIGGTRDDPQTLPSPCHRWRCSRWSPARRRLRRPPT